MLKSIVQYINTRLLTTGYFNNLYELVEIKPQKAGSAPMVYCTGGEYKDINTEKNTSYVRLLRNISITESSKVYRSGEVVLNVTIPLRIVGLIRNVNEDDSYKGVNLAGDICKSISENSMIASLVNARTIDFIPTSLLVNSQELYRQEFPGTEKTDARYEYTMAGVDFNVIIDITQECWETACGNTTTDCQILLASLTSDEKNECILPSYNFADPEVYENLTTQQETDLIDLLCSGGGDCDNITIQDTEDFSQIITCAQSPYTIPDRTIEVFLDGISQGSVTVPALSDNTINIVWT